MGQDPDDVVFVHEGEWTVSDARHWIKLLNTLVSQRGGLRPVHLYADLAVIMAAHHVSEYASAVLLVLTSNVPGTAYPLLRAAFETYLDLLLLVTSGDDFDLAGTKAYVAARVSDYAYMGSQRRAATVAKAEWPKEKVISLRERLRHDADTWDKLCPGRGSLVHEAHAAVRQAREKGRKHWTGYSRDEIHKVIEGRLKEPGAAAVFHGMYDQMAARSHSGMRLGAYVRFGPRIQLRSAPEMKDPFPLEALGYILENSVTALAAHHGENPIEVLPAPA